MSFESRKSVLFFVEGEDVPSSRFRIEQYLSLLEEDGICYKVLTTWPNKYLSYPDWSRNTPFRYFFAAFGLVLVIVTRIIQIIRYAREFEVVVLQRDYLYRISKPFLEEFLFWWLRSARKNGNLRVVYDVDDAIYLGRDRKASPSLLLKQEEIARECDLVIVGNKYLEKQYELWASTIVIPTVIPTEDYPLSRLSGDQSLIIGWIGQSSNFHYLLPLEELLQDLQREFDFEVHLIAEEGAENPFSSLHPTLLPWSREDELSLLARFDIGIMPLADSEWEQRKCGFKLLQYMAMGQAAVASPVGVNADIVEHGVNGMLASNLEEWHQSLHKLIQDQTFREYLGKNARQRVEGYYSRSRWYSAWKEALFE